MNLCEPRTIKSLLEKYSLAPKKKFGQNFLTNPSVPENIAEASRAASDGASVLEIGPGLGVLTQELCDRFEKVVAVEIDTGLLPLLDETLEEFPNVEIVSGDFMKLDVPAFLSEKFGNTKPAVCANLAFDITSPIRGRLIVTFPYSESLPYSSITVMVQAEVADRISAAPGSADYGSITAEIALRCSARRVMTVSPGSFFPPPKVTSAVIQLIPHERGIYSVYPDAPTDREECNTFGQRVSELITAAFLMRRKTLVNAASSIYRKEDIASALESMGQRPDVRGERLSAADFCRLTALLNK